MRIRAQDENNNFTLLRLLLALAVVFGHFKLLSGIRVPASSRSTWRMRRWTASSSSAAS